MCRVKEALGLQCAEALQIELVEFSLSEFLYRLRVQLVDARSLINRHRARADNLHAVLQPFAKRERILTVYHAAELCLAVL